MGAGSWVEGRASGTPTRRVKLSTEDTPRGLAAFPSGCASPLGAQGAERGQPLEVTIDALLRR